MNNQPRKFLDKCIRMNPIESYCKKNCTRKKGRFFGYGFVVGGIICGSAGVFAGGMVVFNEVLSIFRGWLKNNILYDIKVLFIPRKITEFQVFSETSAYKNTYNKKANPVNKSHGQVNIKQQQQQQSVSGIL